VVLRHLRHDALLEDLLLAGLDRHSGGCFADDPLEPPSVTVSNDGRCTWLGLPAEWRTAL